MDCMDRTDTYTVRLGAMSVLTERGMLQDQRPGALRCWLKP